MKKIIIIISTIAVIGCSSSNKVGSVKVNKENQVADNSGLVCKKNRKTGSRINSTVCITKEQQAKERRDSQEAWRNATNTQQNTVPGAVGK